MSIKIVVGAAIAAFLAINAVGASVVFGSMSAFERVSDVAERYTDDDGPHTERGEYRDDDDGFDDGFDDDDGFDVFDGFDGGRGADSFRAPAPNLVGGIPAPGFFEGKGKGGKGDKGGKGAWEMAYAVENASVGAGEAEDVALGEVSGRIVETKLKGKDGFPHYEIEVYDDDGQLHEVLVGAREGDVIGRKVEEPEESYKIGYLLDQTNIDRDEAESAATDAFPGRVVENKLDDENGFAVWEIETLDEESGLLHEVKVNARNGDILF